MKILTDNNGNVYIDSNSKALTSEDTPGPSSGYRVYYYHKTNSSTGDTAYMQINGGTAFKMTTAMLDAPDFITASAIICDKVNTIKMWGFDHGGQIYPSTSASWVRYRNHSGGTWTNYTCSRTEAGAATITLTEDIDLEVFEGTCLNKGTLISMADGTKKPVEEIEVGDIVKGYDGNKVVRRSQKGSKQYLEFRDVWNFENDIQIITTGRHEFYNYDKQKMMYMDEWEIGDRAVCEDGSYPKLLEHRYEDIPCMHFSLWTEENEEGYGENYYAGGLLSGNRYTGELAVK